MMSFGSSLCSKYDRYDISSCTGTTAHVILYHSRIEMDEIKDTSPRSC
jgi:hypothetical protein